MASSSVEPVRAHHSCAQHNGDPNAGAEAVLLPVPGARDEDAVLAGREADEGDEDVLEVGG